MDTPSTRRWSPVIVLLLGLFAGLLPAHAIPGSVMLPCSSPTSTRLNVTGQGVCGHKISSVGPGSHFTLTPTPSSADLDIYFYASETACANGTSTTCPLAFFGCGSGQVTGFVPSDAAYAIVTLSDASVQIACPPGMQVHAGTHTGVTFTYTEP